MDYRSRAENSQCNNVNLTRRLENEDYSFLLLFFYSLSKPRLSCFCLYCSLTFQSTIFQACEDGGTASWVLTSTLGSKCFLGFFFNSVLHPFQDYFSSYETDLSVGGRKREDPEKNHLAHPQAELGLSHMWPERGSNPHKTQR